MADLGDLYQQLIIEHNRSPRNFKALAHPSRSAEGSNPLCGDQIRLEVELEAHIRDEQRFASVESLVAQMHDDERRARAILGA